MDSIYTGIDLGSHSIKIVVCEKKNDKFNCLAATSVKARGIKEGQIVDTKLAVSSVKEALKDIEEMLGFKIKKVIACVPPTDCKMDILRGSAEVSDYNSISGTDISNCIVDALKDMDFKEEELVTSIPISFKVDGKEEIKDPKKMHGSNIETKVVISTLEKEPLYRLLEVLKLSGLETVDIAYTSTGDYYAVKNKKLDELVGAIINIGENKTNVAIYNRGIQIKNSVIPVGSKNVDKDIAYIYKIDLKQAKKLKENFAVAVSKKADNTDVIEVTNSENETNKITQVDISKVVEARLRELLKLVKNEIKNLTNREIRYIIITGGLSEMAGFQNIVDDEFGFVARVCNISTIGVRHNKYSSSLGIIKYFFDKLSLRGKTYNMVDDEEINNLIKTTENVVENTDENITSKIFRHFFDD